MKEECEAHLLSDQERFTQHEHSDRIQKPPPFRLRIFHGFLYILLTLSLCANVLFLLHVTWIAEKASSELCKAYTDLEPNTIQTLRTADNAYVKAPSSPNDTSRDEMWASMNLDRIVVALDHEEARHLGLPKSTNFIWDDTKEYFGINAYHQLHCLQSLYTTVLEDHRGIQPRTQDYEHLVHCLDYLRQDVICVADDTLLYHDPAAGRQPGEGVKRQCKDFSKLEEWAFDSERNACATTTPKKNDVSKYRLWNHCPPDSPFFPKMREHYGYDDDWQIDYEVRKDLDGPAVQYS